MEAWKPGFLIQDDANIAYQPTDKQGKQVAALVKLELTMIMWRAKMQKPTRRDVPVTIKRKRHA